jgi:hypothetical protein
MSKFDCFEYRWNGGSEDYYLFNPWTGETIFNTKILDRSISLWVEPEKYPSDNAVNTFIYPEYYASRRWGRRKFLGFNSFDDAATHICSVARGFLARQRLRLLFRSRFYTSIDKFSGYYYFVDSKYPEVEPTWYKPRLAFPDDIKPFVGFDPDDYMNGDKFSNHDHTRGPFLKVAGLSKINKIKPKHNVFFIENKIRENALKKYEDIDIDNISFNSVLPWMDSLKVVDLKINEYHIMRTAICDNNWNRVLIYMKKYSDNIYIQIFGFNCFAKSEIPLDSFKNINDVMLLFLFYFVFLRFL